MKKRMVSQSFRNSRRCLLTSLDEDEDGEGADEEVDDEDVIYQPEFDDGTCLLKVYIYALISSPSR
jgi:hypothetical protein